MQKLKQRLQKWLGIEAVATRLAELDLELHPPEIPVGYSLPADYGDFGVHDVPYDQSVDLLNRSIKKGYERSV